MNEKSWKIINLFGIVIPTINNNKEEHSIIKISYWNAIGVFITNESHTDNSMRPRFVTKIVYQNCFTKKYNII